MHLNKLKYTKKKKWEVYGETIDTVSQLYFLQTNIEDFRHEKKYWIVNSVVFFRIEANRNTTDIVNIMQRHLYLFPKKTDVRPTNSFC